MCETLRGNSCYWTVSISKCFWSPTHFISITASRSLTLNFAWLDNVKHVILLLNRGGDRGYLRYVGYVLYDDKLQTVFLPTHACASFCDLSLVWCQKDETDSCVFVSEKKKNKKKTLVLTVTVLQNGTIHRTMQILWQDPSKKQAVILQTNNTGK